MTTTRVERPSARLPIQQISSPSVNVFWLNLDQARTCLKKAVIHLAEKHPEIEQVWLFGSLARGDAVPRSDADILIGQLISRIRYPVTPWRTSCMTRSAS